MIIDKDKNEIVGRLYFISCGSFYVKIFLVIVEEVKCIVYGVVFYYIKNS